jgi:hypothetical protein
VKEIEREREREYDGEVVRVRGLAGGRAGERLCFLPCFRSMLLRDMSTQQTREGERAS